MGQPPRSAGTEARSGTNGGYVDALRPACPSWTAGVAPAAASWAVIGANASSWRSFQRPRSLGLMRPSGFTAVDSTMTAPAPPTARECRCVACHDVAAPASGPVAAAEYWHIGAIQTRLRTVTSRKVIGSKRMLTPRYQGRGTGRYSGAGAGVTQATSGGRSPVPR